MKSQKKIVINATIDQLNQILDGAHVERVRLGRLVYQESTMPHIILALALLDQALSSAEDCAAPTEDLPSKLASGN